MVCPLSTCISFFWFLRAANVITANGNLKKTATQKWKQYNWTKHKNIKRKKYSLKHHNTILCVLSSRFWRLQRQYIRMRHRRIRSVFFGLNHRSWLQRIQIANRRNRSAGAQEWERVRSVSWGVGPCGSGGGGQPPRKQRACGGQWGEMYADTLSIDIPRSPPKKIPDITELQFPVREPECLHNE